MVRSESLFYGLMSVVFITIYQGVIHQYLVVWLGLEADIANMLLGNIIAWLISVAVTFIILKKVKGRHRGQAEYNV